MAFVIESDFSFPKVGAPAGRKDRGDVSGVADDAFARALERGGKEAGTAQEASDRSGNDAAPESTLQMIPHLETDSRTADQPVEAMEDGRTPDPDARILTATAPGIPTGSIAPQTKKSEAEDTDTANIADIALPVASEISTTSPASSRSTATAGATETAAPAKSAIPEEVSDLLLSADAKQKTRVLELDTAPADETAVAADTAVAGEAAGLPLPADAIPEADVPAPASAQAPAGPFPPASAQQASRTKSSEPKDTAASDTAAVQAVAGNASVAATATTIQSDARAIVSDSSAAPLTTVAAAAATPADTPVLNQTVTGKPAPVTTDKPDTEFHPATSDSDTIADEPAVANAASGQDTGKATGAPGASPLPDTAMIGAAQTASSAPAAQQAQTSNPAANLMAPTHGIVTASPAETVRIVSDSIGNPDDRQDRITVQLDPPELGRVSIDFKFDSNGLQHVTITGDNPEAMRQLRLMHFELTQALERNGLSSENMSFQQNAQSGQQQQNAQSGAVPRSFNTAALANSSTSLSSASASSPDRPARTAGSGLDIKL